MKIYRNTYYLNVSEDSGTSSSNGWQDKPTFWYDIRTSCPENSIALYAAHAENYSSYDNLGFTAGCEGGYKVFIDGTQYGTTYASGATCSITWSESSITTGDSITVPSALKAHVIWITPATEGAEITKFCCQRVAESGVEEQGVLWAHFNLTNAIGLDSLFADSGYKNTLVKAVTAKGNKITVTSQYSWASGLYLAFCNCELLEYLPTLNTRQETNVSYYETFKNCAKLTSVKLTQGGTNASSYGMFDSSGITEVKGNFTIVPVERMFKNCQDITKLPAIYATNSTNCADFITNAESLDDTVLDMRAATGLTAIGCYGTAEHFMAGFKGLRVSSSAPFSGSDAQINVSYTGMNRTALVQLFNDLPTVTDGQIINITGCTGSEYLTAEDVAVATNKGWTVSGGPVFEDFYAYTNANDTTIYTTDNPINRGTFTLQNASVVGTLNNDNGRYNGFSGSDYMVTTPSFRPVNNTFTIYAKVQTGGDVTSEQFFVSNGGYYDRVMMGVNNGHFYVKLNGLYEYATSIGTITGSMTVTPYTDYIVKLEYTGTAYNFYIKTLSQAAFTLDGSITGATVAPISDVDYPLSLGANWFYDGVNCPWKGTFDINGFKWEINGVETVFAQVAELSKLYNSSLEELNKSYELLPNLTNCTNWGCTHTGSVYNGVYNKLMVGTSVPALSTADSWEIRTKFTKTSQTYARQDNLICPVDDYYKYHAPRLFFNNYTAQLSCIISSNGTSRDIYDGIIKDITTEDTFTPDLNTPYYIQLGFTGTMYYFRYSKTMFNDPNSAPLILKETTDKATCTSPFAFLGSTDNNINFQGNMDMAETSLIIDNTITNYWTTTPPIVVDNVTYDRNSEEDIIN